ncbi:MAG: hypothetical protein CM1200mP30_34380 [Pseudomonadota bacterium]|nr:MAG: hypothetical protein CM1200mP30_34380 [Pseudomonadota bacterium]
MNLNYVVLTTVNRDDFPDQGALTFQNASKQSKSIPRLLIEMLMPDFRSEKELIQRLLMPRLQYGHNLETVRRLTPEVRDYRADYNSR